MLKTTILESIYLLSFSKLLGNNLDKMIQNGKTSLKITKLTDNTSNDTICIEKSLKSPKISFIKKTKHQQKTAYVSFRYFSMFWC